MLSKLVHNRVKQTDAGGENMKIKLSGWELVRSVMWTNTYHSILVETGGVSSLFFWLNDS